MKLAIFDIDGTLTRSNSIDERCFLAAAQKLIDPSIEAIIPADFSHYTDQNIVLELYQWHLSRKPTSSEYEAFRQYVLEAFKLEKEANSHSFEAVPGAQHLLRTLGNEWIPAMATGCWLASAHLKLDFAGIDFHGIPLANSDEALSREEIIENAIQKATYQHRINQFEKVVYIGDGIWDLKTCANLKIPFVGIEAEDKTEKQEALGSFLKLKDYLDLGQVIDCLETATVPTIKK